MWPGVIGCSNSDSRSRMKRLV
uniref:Uncharacterized protein n=1 Tax=Anguilla anguilla TaxID=7936 RepID=A0A0E9QJI5_ANGAN